MHKSNEQLVVVEPYKEEMSLSQIERGIRCMTILWPRFSGCGFHINSMFSISILDH